MIWQGEMEYKVEADEIEEDLERIKREPQGGFILNRDYAFWGKYIRPDGRLDVAALQSGKRRFRDEQIPYISEEMIKLGWLKESPPVAITAPLEPVVEYEAEDLDAFLPPESETPF